MPPNIKRYLEKPPRNYRVLRVSLESDGYHIELEGYGDTKRVSAMLVGLRRPIHITWAPKSWKTKLRCKVSKIVHRS